MNCYFEVMQKDGAIIHTHVSSQHLRGATEQPNTTKILRYEYVDRDFEPDLLITKQTL